MIKPTKKITVLLLALLLLLTFAGCGTDTQNTTPDKKLQIIATNFPAYDFSRWLAQDVTEVLMLTPPGQEGHTFEPTPKDMLQLEQADLFIMGGGKSDEWAKKLADSAGLEKQNILAMMKCVTPIAEEHAHEDHSHNFAYDEHVWTSPLNAIEICKHITDALCTLSPQNAPIFQKNLNQYTEKLQKLDNEFLKVVENSPRKTLLFGDRFPFRYFAERYGLSYYAAFPGCAQETEPDAATMKFLIDKVNQEKIPVVLHMELSNLKVANAICEATEAKPLLLHACHGVTKEELASGVTYYSLMEQNLAVLKEALS